MQVSGGTGSLILVAHHADSPLEEPAEISRAQAEELLKLTAGRIEYLSIPVDFGARSAIIQRFIIPAALDLISVAFKHDKAACKFQRRGSILGDCDGPARWRDSLPCVPAPVPRGRDKLECT